MPSFFTGSRTDRMWQLALGLLGQSPGTLRSDVPMNYYNRRVSFPTRPLCSVKLFAWIRADRYIPFANKSAYIDLLAEVVLSWLSEWRLAAVSSHSTARSTESLKIVMKYSSRQLHLWHLSIALSTFKNSPRILISKAIYSQFNTLRVRSPRDLFAVYIAVLLDK